MAERKLMKLTKATGLQGKKKTSDEHHVAALEANAVGSEDLEGLIPEN